MTSYLKKLLSKLDISSSDDDTEVFEHAVLVYFDYNLESSDPFYKLVDELIHYFHDNHLGEYDGHEMAMDNSDGSLYMYGNNAQDLFNGVEPILRKTDFLKGAVVVLRFGKLDDDKVQILEITL